MNNDPNALTLYHLPRSRSSVVLWLLEEIGQPYTLKVLNTAVGEQRSAAYLAINPMGKAPALVHGGTVIAETAAICCYLAEAFPAAGLAVPLGDRQRGSYLKWMFFAPGCLEPAIMDKMFERPAIRREAQGYGDFAATLAVIAAALVPGPHLLGEPFTAADVGIGSLLRWGRLMGIIGDQPALSAYVARLEGRPAHRRAREKDEALVPPPAA